MEKKNYEYLNRDELYDISIKYNDYIVGSNTKQTNETIDEI